MIHENEHWRDNLPAGWGALYLGLLADLAASGCDVKVVEAKEKFGSLRISIEHGDAAAKPLIAAAEERSKTICQACGEAGALLVRNHHYITLCPFHGKGYSKPRRKPMVTLDLRDLSIDE